MVTDPIKSHPWRLSDHDVASYILALGTFDGLHRGHQGLLQATQQLARTQQVGAAICLFEPHPRAFFAPEQAPCRLTTLREQFGLLQPWQIDRVALTPFTATLAQCSPVAFMAHWLRQGAVGFVCGSDFRFGYRRSGDVPLLRRLSQAWRFELEVLDDVCLSGERISSTACRQALLARDWVHLKHLLGRDYTLTLRVGQQDSAGYSVHRRVVWPHASTPGLVWHQQRWVEADLTWAGYRGHLKAPKTREKHVFWRPI